MTEVVDQGRAAAPFADPATFLATHEPFASLSRADLKEVVASSRSARYAGGALILDAFRDPTVEVFVVVSGRVALWNDTQGFNGPPDEFVDVGGVFGFSAMLTERSVGPRAVASEAVEVLRIPGSAAAPAFGSAAGIRFLAEHITAVRRPADPPATYATVDDLLVRAPLVVDPATPVSTVAKAMTDAGTVYAAVPVDGGYGVVTDAVLRRAVLAQGRDPATPAEAVMVASGPLAVLGDAAVATYISLLERGDDVRLVVDRAGALQGAVLPQDFAVSPGAASASLPEQLRRATSTDALKALALQVPSLLTGLLAQGLSSSRVIAVHSVVLDTIARRAIGLVMAQHPELDPDAFTWLSLGSNGRREAVLSSDIDSAVAFSDDVTAKQATQYRAAFASVGGVLSGAGLSRDTHGASAQQEPFSRTHAEWRAAGLTWLAAPTDNNGAMMTSLLVDGRPIHGDPGLPEVARVFADLRRHPGTMRLLLQESLSVRARRHSLAAVLRGRSATFDLKTHALLPVVNIGRWAALSVGSSALPTVERLRAAAGSAMLPQDHATTLVEVFEVLQRLRLRYQLRQIDAGESPTDVLDLERVSPIDRSVISQAVREVAATQKRMANIASYLEPKDWATQDSTDRGTVPRG